MIIALIIQAKNAYNIKLPKLSENIFEKKN